MLSEVPVAGVLLPPFLVYCFCCWPLFIVVRRVLLRGGLLRRVWHPALCEFTLSILLLAVLILYV